MKTVFLFLTKTIKHDIINYKVKRGENMILCTGDLHGTNGFKRLKPLVNYDLTYEDYLIVVGDFGVIWHNMGQSHHPDKNQEGLKWLRENINCNILFIDGN